MGEGKERKERRDQVVPLGFGPDNSNGCLQKGKKCLCISSISSIRGISRIRLCDIYFFEVESTIFMFKFAFDSPHLYCAYVQQIFSYIQNVSLLGYSTRYSTSNDFQYVLVIIK